MVAFFVSRVGRLVPEWLEKGLQMVGTGKRHHIIGLRKERLTMGAKKNHLEFQSIMYTSSSAVADIPRDALQYVT